MSSLTIFLTCSLWISGVVGDSRHGNLPDVKVAKPPWEATASSMAAAKPTWEPTRSDEHFMKKDLPFDKRPKVDVLHFKHPYPIVQDSGDFDRDYVKDENGDNGEWKAQTTYDVLRHKLAKQKAELKKAKEAEQKAQQELEEKQKKADAAAKAAAEAARRSDEIENAKHKNGGSYDVTITRQKKAAAAADLPEEPDVAGGTKATQEAMRHLEDCKKELEEAREHLKRLMKELEEAKKAAEVTQVALDKAEAHLKRLQKDEDSVVKHVAAKKDDYMDAKKAYEQQLALVNKMESDIKIAEEKVRAMRDAEDSNGGVYNTPQEDDNNHFKLPKAAAPVFAIPSVLLFAVLTALRL